MGCCCKNRVPACNRDSFIEVQGIGAQLKSLDYTLQSPFANPFFFGQAYSPALANVDISDDSGLFGGTVVSKSYHATDFVWIQYHSSTRGAPLSYHDNLVWSITRNGSSAGFSNRTWSFRGIEFLPEFQWHWYKQGRANHAYVLRFNWTFNAVNYSADIYIPEQPLRDWSNPYLTNGLAGGFVMFQGRKYTFDYHIDPTQTDFADLPPPGPQNSLRIFTDTANKIYMEFDFAFPDDTTTSAGSTTTTQNSEHYAIAIEYKLSGARDYLLHADKGQTTGFVPVVGAYKYKTNCKETQNYPVSGFPTDVLIKPSACSEASLALMDSTRRRSNVFHTPFLSGVSSTCVGSNVTTTTQDDCYVYEVPTDCDLPCIDAVDEASWLTPISCAYNVSAHDITWNLFANSSSDIAISPKRRLLRIASEYYWNYRTNGAPIADLLVVNRISGTSTEPWLILKLGVSIQFRYGWGGVGYFNFWLAAYGLNISYPSYGSVDLIRDSNVTMSRVWQYGEDLDYCNELDLLDFRAYQQHNYKSKSLWVNAESGFSSYGTDQYHPYDWSSTFNSEKPSHPKFFFDVGSWLKSTSTTTSGGDLYYPNTFSGQFTRFSSTPDQYQCINTSRGWYLTDPEWIRRPHCTIADDGLTDSQLYSQGFGSIPVDYTEYWLDMPATVELEAI